ncbi:MAG TPA: hypothetical protein VMZ92_12305 [Planctomycetota bacterium]|nr:hypothetical protein [Planctomycetota bacterium]
MSEQPVMHDERTDAVVGMSCRLAYVVLSFGVLIIALVRTLAFRQACWDLLGLYFVSNVVALVHQRIKHAQVIPWRWVLLFGVGGMLFAVAIALLQQYF